MVSMPVKLVAKNCDQKCEWKRKRRKRRQHHRFYLKWKHITDKSAQQMRHSLRQNITYIWSKYNRFSDEFMAKHNQYWITSSIVNTYLVTETKFKFFCKRVTLLASCYQIRMHDSYYFKIQFNKYVIHDGLNHDSPSNDLIKKSASPTD